MQNFFNKYSEVFSVLALVGLCTFFLLYGVNFYQIFSSSEKFYEILSAQVLDGNQLSSSIQQIQNLLAKGSVFSAFLSQILGWVNSINEINPKFPNALLASILVFFVYFLWKAFCSTKFALLNALILLTSFGFLVFSGLNFFNMVVLVFLTQTLYLIFLTSVVEDKYKKFHWWLFYLFLAFTFLVKGIFGLMLPLLVMFVYYSLIKKLKDVFKPINFVVGLLIFLVVTVPCGLDLANVFGLNALFNSVLVPDFKTFVSNMGCYTTCLLLGSMPWTILFGCYIADGIWKAFSRIKYDSKFVFVTFEQKLSLFGLIAFVMSLVIVSLFKFEPYLLVLLLPPLASLVAYLLCSKDVSETFRDKSITLSTNILAVAFTMVTITFAVVYIFLPYVLFEATQNFINVVVMLVNLFAIFVLLRTRNKDLIKVVFSYIFVMLCAVLFTFIHSSNLYNMSSESELVKYSKLVEAKNTKIILYNIPISPMVINENSRDSYVEIKDIEGLNDEIVSNKNIFYYVLVKNKHLNAVIDNDLINLYVIDQGAKYTILSNIMVDKKSMVRSKFFSN